MTEDPFDWLIPVAIVAVLGAVLSTCAEAQEPGTTTQQQAREMTLTEARGAALASPHDPVHCFQERRMPRAHVCITEAEWLRQHADEKNGKEKSPLQAVAGSD